MSIKDLTKSDCRITKNRHFIFHLFHQSKKPISVPYIQANFLKHKIKINKTTIYRQIEFLIKNDLISEISIENTKYYQLKKNQNQGLIVCHRCQQFKPLKLDNNLMTKLQKSILAYKFNFHKLIIFGECQKCQKL